MSASILLQNGTVLCHDEQDNHVNVLRNTDILVDGDKIAEIGQNIKHADDGSILVVDCTDKIISPGFINTHAHLWQTQLKGRHADETLFDYFTSANIQQFNYTPEDIFWGVLAGAMESVDAGTTSILDHAHCCVNVEMEQQALAATITSGIRCLFAYGKPFTPFKRWNMEEIVSDESSWPPDMSLDRIEELAKNQPYGNGRVTIGMAFDTFWFPEQFIKDTFARAIKAGVKGMTTHIVRGALFGSLHSTLQVVNNYNLLTTTPNYVLSHCTNLPPEDYELLAQTQTAISSTPETEAQMGHGQPPFLQPGLNVSLGVDCHTNNTSYMPRIATTGLFCARLTTNNELLAKDKFPGKLRGTTEQLFNAITVQGARAMGMLDQVGSIKVGKKADLVVFDTKYSTTMTCVADTDPLVAVVRHSDVRDVEIVIVDGVVRKWEGKLCAVTRQAVGGVSGNGVGNGADKMDWSRVRNELVRSTKDIWARDAKCSRPLAIDFVKKTLGTDDRNFVDVD